MRLRNLLPGALSRQLQRLVFSLLGVATAGAFAAAAGCGGTTSGMPVIGGESHFLHWCSDDCGQAGLQCISGLCTQPCVVAEANACSAFSDAICTAESIEPGAVAVCDVSCSRNSDCAALGSDYRCEGSFCRVPEIASASGGAGGSAGSGASAGSSGLSCAECFDAPTLKWTSVGGDRASPTRPSSDLSNCNYYHHELVREGVDDPLAPPLPQCTAPVDGCPSLTLARLNATVTDTALQAGLAQHTLFGRDQRPVDGSILQVSVGDSGASFLVGAPCAGTSEDCIEIPPAVASLVTQLHELDQAQSSKESCSSAFPDGIGN